MKAVIYTRISTTHQDSLLQKNDCHRVIVSRKLNFSGVYPDVGTGAEKERPALDSMLKDARRGLFGVVVVWSLDRIARNTGHLLNIYDDLHSAGIELVSVKEAIDFTSPLGKALLAVRGVFAEMERELLRERIKAGIQVAREKGTILGRPRVLSEYDEHEILELRDKGLSCAKIAALLNKHRRKPVHRATIHRFLTAAQSLNWKGGRSCRKCQ